MANKLAKSTRASRVSNDTHLFVEKVDLRHQSARRWRDLHEQLSVVALQTSEASLIRKQLIRRCVTCCALAEELEARAARGERVDGLEYSRLTFTTLRLLRALNLPIGGDSRDDDDDDDGPRLRDLVAGSDAEVGR